MTLAISAIVNKNETPAEVYFDDFKVTKIWESRRVAKKAVPTKMGHSPSHLKGAKRLMLKLSI